ncbi:MAG: class I SAM-dependent RNA methyltransferase [Firmicutes bacterium]|nr:class I SAM-dependent RNA methyltransferase [Bacillota bacterium]
MSSIDLIATCAFGLEAALSAELKALNYTDIKTSNGQVSFTADISAIPRCNLWLRSADRLLIKVGSFPAYTFDELFEQTKSLPWPDYLPQDANFPVIGKSVKSKLFSVSDCQAITKKAVVEKMKSKYPTSWFAENGPIYRIEVALLNDVATLTIDTSGAGLHKRGYRTMVHPAPLKETLAAALVYFSRWKPDRAFADPFGGSGTIVIEAALQGRNIAPGLKRSFVAENWPLIPEKLWQSAREEALDLINHRQPLGIFYYDHDPKAVQMAKLHAAQAGLDEGIIFERRPVKDLNSRYQYGYLVTNPPYGERMTEETSDVYKQLPQALARLDTWSHYLITAYPGIEKIMNRKADKKRKLYNGRILCYYYQYFGPKPKELAGPFAMDSAFNDDHHYKSK